MTTIKSILLLVMALLCFSPSFAQYTSGKIVYERKTNLYKKYKDFEQIKTIVKEEDKVKVDVFELYFNDSVSVFQPQATDLKDEMSWATQKNVVYQNFNSQQRLTVKDMWGEKMYLTDSLRHRTWKITDSKRNISGYNCRKAIWQVNDSTRIYAWYTDELMVSTGPESFNGLPGTILGLAQEDGGVIYFAKSVDLNKPDMKPLIPEVGKNKVYTEAELKAKLQKQFGKEEWGQRAIEQAFSIW